MFIGIRVSHNSGYHFGGSQQPRLEDLGPKVGLPLFVRITGLLFRFQNLGMKFFFLMVRITS